MANEQQPNFDAISAALGTLLEEAPRLANLQPIQAHQEILAAIRGLQETQNNTAAAIRGLQETQNNTAAAIQVLQETQNNTAAAIRGLQETQNNTAAAIQVLQETQNNTAAAMQTLRGDIQALREDMNIRLGRLECQYINILRRNLNSRLCAMSLSSPLFPLLDPSTGQTIVFFPRTIAELVQLDEAMVDRILAALQVPAAPSRTVETKREDIRSLWA